MFLYIRLTAGNRILGTWRQDSIPEQNVGTELRNLILSLVYKYTIYNLESPRNRKLGDSIPKVGTETRPDGQSNVNNLISTTIIELIVVIC